MQKLPALCQSQGNCTLFSVVIKAILNRQDTKNTKKVFSLGELCVFVVLALLTGQPLEFVEFGQSFQRAEVIDFQLLQGL